MVSKSPKARLSRSGGPPDGPSLLLIHGFGSDRYSWAATAPAFLESHSVWSVELPGHGGASDEVGDAGPQSMAHAVLDGLGDSVSFPMAVVGHSLGGAVAIELAHLAPERIRHAVLLAPAGLGATFDTEFVRLFPALDDAQAAEMLLKRLVANPRLISPQMVQHVLSGLARPERRDALRRIADRLTDLPRPVVPETLRMTVIWGEKDAINMPDLAWLGDMKEKAHILADTGHMPHVERAKKVNAIVADAIGLG